MALVDLGAVTLAKCPVGLFLADDGSLCLKTEYGNNEGRIDAYIVSSGEFFWGAKPQTIARQRAQLVTPLDEDAVIAAIRALPSQTVQAGSEAVPVAWQWRYAVGPWSDQWNVEKEEPRPRGDRVVRSLYADPPPAVPVDAIGVVEGLRAKWQAEHDTLDMGLDVSDRIASEIKAADEILAALRKASGGAK